MTHTPRLVAAELPSHPWHGHIETDAPDPDLCGHILSSPGLGMPAEVLCELDADHGDYEYHRNFGYALMWDDTGTIH